MRGRATLKRVYQQGPILSGAHDTPKPFWHRVPYPPGSAQENDKSYSDPVLGTLFDHRVKLHLKVPHLIKPDYDLFLGFSFGFSLRIAGFDDMAVMGQSIKQRSRHLFITKDIRPFNEADIGGNNNAGASIQLAEKME